MTPFQRFLGVEVARSSRIELFASVKVVHGGHIKIGHNCKVMRGAIIWTYGGFIEIGDNCSVEPYCVLYGHGGLTIGNGVRIAAHTVIIPSNHKMEPGSFIYEQEEVKLGIKIEDDVWIGSGCHILDGVTLAEGSVIGAGAVVTKSTEPYGVYVGVPARRIRSRKVELIVDNG